MQRRGRRNPIRDRPLPRSRISRSDERRSNRMKNAFANSWKRLGNRQPRDHRLQSCRAPTFRRDLSLRCILRPSRLRATFSLAQRGKLSKYRKRQLWHRSSRFTKLRRHLRRKIQSNRRRKDTRRPLGQRRSSPEASQTSRRSSARQQVYATRSSFAKFSDRREVCNLSILSEALGLRRGLRSFRFSSPAWRNWQTLWTQNPYLY